MLYCRGNIEQFAIPNASALSSMGDNNMLANASASPLSIDIPENF
jgi:hypothetical protein